MGPAIRRPPLRTPFYVKLIDATGRLWDIFPWIGLVLYLGGAWSRFGSTPDFVILIVMIGSLIWWPLYLFWIICDVLHFRSGWWWILIGIFCYPVGLFLYLMSGRQV